MAKIIFICITFYFLTVLGVFAQESVIQSDNRRPVLNDDINRDRILEIGQNIQLSDKIANINEEQRNQIKKFDEELNKDLTKLGEQLLDLQEHLQKLETQEVVNMKAINRNIDQQAKVIAKIMKLKAQHKQKVRKILEN